MVHNKLIFLYSKLRDLSNDSSLKKILLEEDQDNSVFLNNFFIKELPPSDKSSLYVWGEKDLLYWNLGAYEMYFEQSPGVMQVQVLSRENLHYYKFSLPSAKGRLGMVYVLPQKDFESMVGYSGSDIPVYEDLSLPDVSDILRSQSKYANARFMLLSYLIGYLFLIAFIFVFARKLVDVFPPERVFIGLVLVLSLLRGMGYFFPLSHPSLGLIWEPGFMGPDVPGSLMDWLLNILVLFLFALFFYIHFPNRHKIVRRNHALFYTFLAYLIFCCFCILFTFYVRSLVNNPFIHIDINIIEHLTGESLLLLVASFILLLSLFIVSIRMFITIQSFDWTWLKKILIFFSALLVSSVMLFISGLEVNLWLWAISLLIITLLFDLFLDSSMRDFTWISVWLLILSLFSTVLFYHFYKIELSRESFETLHQKIDYPDRYLMNMISTLEPEGGDVVLNETTIEHRLNDALFCHPSIRTAYSFAVDARSDVRANRNFEEIRYHYQDDWPGTYLFRLSSIQSSAVVRARAINSTIEYQTDKGHRNERVLFRIGDWTIYDQGKITNDESLFFPPALDSLTTGALRDSQFVRDNTIYTLVSRGDKAALGRQEFDGLLQPMSFFSFNFILSLMILGFLVLVQKFIPFLPFELHQYFIENLSIRNKIQFSVLAILIAAFAIIGLVSANFYKRSYKETLQSTVKEYYQRVKRARFDRDEIVKVLEGLPGLFTLYNDQGQIIQSVVPEQNNRLPYSVVRKIELSETLANFDEIWPGTLVLPFSLDHRNAAFLVYPELTSVPEGFYRFINLLLNAFVFLLLISSAISFSISNTIISPLTELGKKLKQFSLGKRNEPISWKQPDELGALIQAYNEMVEKLEQSAELLAHSEREVAWREMAKQVAHEIKNPLTPMKLSIQHMDARIRDGDDQDPREIVRDVSKILIEQIDNLSRIASEFSSFAKLPRPKYEEILLNDLVASVYELFRTRSRIKFNLYVPIDEMMVQADRTHLIRVMNNLMKNAVQSIPPDQEGHIVIRLKEHNGHAIVMVEDNGKGIEKEVREKVFFPNFTTKSSGTGLGLAICKNIIETFSGTIYFITNKPKGTIFIFELPLVNEIG